MVRACCLGAVTGAGGLTVCNVKSPASAPSLLTATGVSVGAAGAAPAEDAGVAVCEVGPDAAEVVAAELSPGSFLEEVVLLNAATVTGSINSCVTTALCALPVVVFVAAAVVAVVVEVLVDELAVVLVVAVLVDVVLVVEVLVVALVLLVSAVGSVVDVLVALALVVVTGAGAGTTTTAALAVAVVTATVRVTA